jgi:hypothetical protein
MREGAALYRHGDAASALEKFQAAYDAFPSPRILFNIGQAQRDLQRPVEARESFDRFLTEATDAPADAVAEARRSLAELESKLARLNVQCWTRGAQVSLDGRPLGTTPLAQPLWTTAGRHQLTLRHRDFSPQIRDLDLPAGKIESVEIVMSPLAAPSRASGRSPVSLTTSAEPSPVPRAHDSPIYTRWWFWTAVSVVAIGAGAALICRDPGLSAA